MNQILDYSQDETVAPNTVNLSDQNQVLSNVFDPISMTPNITNTNINNNCKTDNKKKNIDISVDTGEHTYGYGLVSFKKKYVKYLYSFFDKYINLSNWIYYIEYKKMVHQKIFGYLFMR
jgi:hypothetical protein